MSSEVWYRKWRPQTFADVAGQSHITVTLARAVALKRVAHAYLFCGPRGTGKTTTARILAKAINCEANEAGQPCTRCESCLAVADGRALDLIEMDAASNRSIDHIRDLRDRVGYSPNSSEFKVYLIDEVHELTPQAFDALLKTLEEPPPHVIFILATTESHKVPETIVSRCQRFDFVRIKLADAVGRLRAICDGEGIVAEDGALEILARRATGSLRDGVNLLEQAVASHGEVLTEEKARAATGASGDARAASLGLLVLERNLPDALGLIAAVQDDGVDLRQFIRDTVQYARSLLLLRAGAGGSLALGAEPERELAAVAQQFEVSRLMQVAQTLTRVDLRADPQSALPLELAVVECIEVAAMPAAGAEAHRTSRQVAQPVTPERVPAPVNGRAGAGPSSPSAGGVGQRLSERLASRTEAPAPLSLKAVPDGEPILNRSGNGGVVLPGLEGAPASQAEPRAGVPVKLPAAAAETAAPQSAMPAASDEAPVIAAFSLEQARERFGAFHERAKEIDRRLAPYLGAQCDIVEFGADGIVLGFQHRSHFETVSGTWLTVLRQAAADVYGNGIAVRVVHDGTVKSRMLAFAEKRPSHLLDEALKLGAKPVEPA